MPVNLSSPFYRALDRALAQRGSAISDICPDDDYVARRVLHDYGAMFVGSPDILPPPVCVFTNQEQVAQFQAEAGRAAATIENATIELQPAARDALLRAREVATSEGLN